MLVLKMDHLLDQKQVGIEDGSIVGSEVGIDFGVEDRSLVG
jgi:hypothetical protein